MVVNAMIAMATHITTVMILLASGALPEHSKVKEEMLPALPSDDTSWTCMKIKMYKFEDHVFAANYQECIIKPDSKITPCLPSLIAKVDKDL